MRRLSIPISVRLTASYFLFLAVCLSLFGYFALEGMRRSIFATVNHELGDQTRAIQEIVSHTVQESSLAAVPDELSEHSESHAGSNLFQLSGPDGNLIFQSPSIAKYHLNPRLQPPNKRKIWNIEAGRVPLRIMSSDLLIDSASYRLQVAAPMDEYYEALDRFQGLLFLSAPLLLVLSSVGGYWMSRRALAPVDQIITATQSIGSTNLSSRLPVPASRDELQRLTETLNEMLARIERAFRRISRFTADASHEFRTPVTLMRTRAELALRRPRTESEYRETVEQMHEELVRTSELIERLMVLARTDSGVEALQFKTIDLADVVRAIVEQTHTFAEAKKLRLQSEIPTGPMPIDADSDFLKRLLLILIDNAVKYTPEGGIIAIGLSCQNGTAEVAITDTGIGIAKAELPNIFERFYRTDKARSRESGGAGLGLAIAKWIAEAHRGSISVESTAGLGSSFVLRLPIANSASAATFV